MPYPTTTVDDEAVHAGHVADQRAPRGPYGVAVRDIFSDAGWAPAEPVRARDWHDTGSGARVQWSETTFD